MRLFVWVYNQADHVLIFLVRMLFVLFALAQIWALFHLIDLHVNGKPVIKPMVGGIFISGCMFYLIVKLQDFAEDKG